MRRRDFIKMAAGGAAAAGLLAKGRRTNAQTGAFPKKVIVLGFDGANPEFVEKWMDAGLLPNLATLRAGGTYARIRTANPPQTPVSWASFATGMNPGKTKLFDFLRRNPKTYKPELALIKESLPDFFAGERNPLYAAGGAFVAGGVAGLAVKMLYEVMRRREDTKVLKETFDPALLAVVAGTGLAAGAGAYALAKQYIPEVMPAVENAVQGQTFWQYLDDKSIPTLSFRVPARFPADKLKHGRAVAGLGVPDVLGTTGSFSYYTTEVLGPQETGDSEMGGQVVPLYFKLTGEAKTVVYGPYNQLFLNQAAKELRKKGKDLGDLSQLTIPLTLTQKGDKLRIETPDWSGELGVGQWSKPVTFTFRFNRFITLEGYAKFYLLELTPDVKLYLQAISFHPKTLTVAHGPVRISTPQSFVGELYDTYGPFKTLGWAADTWALNELRIPEEVFLEDLHEFVGQYRQMMMEFLKSKEPLYVHVYSFTDRIAHMFWHHLDPKHPLYTPENAAKYGKVIQEAYQLMDSIVGDVLKATDDQTWLFVLSDHGFHSFRYGFNCNTWLAENGFLVSNQGASSEKMKLEDLFGHSEKFFTFVDWSKSKAYALGLGGIYINAAGREDKGIVTPKEYDSVREQIIKGLEAYVDPRTGERPVFKVYKREDSYTGYDPNEMPDLRMANNPGYRGSWQNALGAIIEDTTAPNKRKWSGDHCTYEPSLTKGIFFCSHKTARTDPDLLDFFPTVLKLFGYTAPGEIDGKSLV